jgi:two-component system chemotaxis response regulator CheY
MKVLIVDDCMIAREMLAVTLERYAHIDQAENGTLALQMVEQALLQDAAYDLICLDLNMPGITGHDVLREIRLKEEQLAAGRRTTVFMITASSSPDDMMEALLSGSCDDFLTKPVMSTTLIELLQKHGLI